MYLYTHTHTHTHLERMRVSECVSMPVPMPDIYIHMMHAQIKDDGELGKKEGLMLPEAKKKYEKKIAEDRAELAKIPTVFPDKGILGGGYARSLSLVPSLSLCVCVRSRVRVHMCDSSRDAAKEYYCTARDHQRFIKVYK